MKRIILTLGLFGLLSVMIAGCSRSHGPIETGPEISRAEIMFAHNKERESRGLDPLEDDPVLQERAQKWAEQMAAQDSLYHSRLSMGGTNYNTMGENIAMGYTTIDSVVDGWMHSPGHRRNILNKHFTRAGFGYAKRADGSPYWCAQFGGN